MYPKTSGLSTYYLVYDDYIYKSYNEIYKDLYISQYLFFNKTTGEREAYQAKDDTSDKMSVHYGHTNNWVKN